MPFGKRPASTTGYRSIAPVERAEPKPEPDDQTPFEAFEPPEPRVEKSTQQRLLDLSETMLGFLKQTATVATAIRTGGAITLARLDAEFQPEATPIDIRVLDEFFTFTERGRTFHPIYGYALPDAPSEANDGAQHHLHQLTSRIIELNVFCQRAAQDDALAVALQLPALPELVDRILVGAAFFTAYFENLALTKAYAGADSERLSSTIDFVGLSNNMERRRLMASDQMLAPDKIGAYAPFGPWPHLGIETLTRAQQGQRFINRIYFPKDKLPSRVPILVRVPATAEGQD